MWVATVSFPSRLIANSPTNFRSHKDLKLRASLYDFPLASKIMVRNLSYSTDESSLQMQFSKFGPIADVKLVKDGLTKRSKGFAFIQYSSQDDAVLALENMDQKLFDGRLIYVEIAKMGNKRFDVDPKASGPPKKDTIPAGNR